MAVLRQIAYSKYEKTIQTRILRITRMQKRCKIGSRLGRSILARMKKLALDILHSRCYIASHQSDLLHKRSQRKSQRTAALSIQTATAATSALTPSKLLTITYLLRLSM